MLTHTDKTVGQLRDDKVGFVRCCVGCGHTESFSAKRVITLPFPDDLPLETAAQRLRCKNCGARAFRIDLAGT